MPPSVYGVAFRLLDVRSTQSSLQAKVSPTCHKRRTRPTVQQNSSAKPCPCWLPVTFHVRSAQSRLQAKVSPTRHTRRTCPTQEINSSAQHHQAAFKAAFKCAAHRLVAGKALRAAKFKCAAPRYFRKLTSKNDSKKRKRYS